MRALQPRLGAVRGARGLPARGRHRRLRPPRPPRGALLVPHAGARPLLGRAAVGGVGGRRDRRARGPPRARAARSRPEDDEGFAAAPAPSCSTTEARHAAARARVRGAGAVAALERGARGRSCASAGMPRRGPRARPPRGRWRARRSASTRDVAGRPARARRRAARPPAGCSGTSGAPAGTGPDRAGAAALLARFRYALLFAAGGARSRASTILGDQPPRRGPGAAGGRAHRGRPAALPRLLRELRPRPVLPGRRAATSSSAPRCSPGGSCACARRHAWPCSPTRWSAATRPSRWRCGAWLAVAAAMAFPSIPHPNPPPLALALRRAPAGPRAARGCAARSPGWRSSSASTSGAGGGSPGRRWPRARPPRPRPAGRARRRGVVAGVLLAPVVLAAPRRLLGPDARLRPRRAGPPAPAAAGRLARRLRAEQDPRASTTPYVLLGGRGAVAGGGAARRPPLRLWAAAPLAARRASPTCWRARTSSTSMPLAASLPVLLATAAARDARPGRPGRGGRRAASSSR